VTFGDGRQGLRLPSGTENVVAAYRVGSGLAGEVEAGSLTSLQNKPLGLAAATNPVPARGAAPADSRDSARRKAPLSVSALGRIVSLRDFEDFVTTYAGIGKARVAQLGNGQARVIHLTILGADRQEVPESSLLYQGLVREIDALRQSCQPVVVQSGEICRFTIGATVVLEPRYQPGPVRAGVERALREAFAFERRRFAQDVPASEVVQLIQQVRGVRAVKQVALCAPQARPCVSWPQPAADPQGLRALPARWTGSEFKPAQLLIADPEKTGITLTMEGADD
jgi:predicted phage baseplate assembly protein